VIVAVNAHRTNYADFYSPRAVGDGRALALVHGNCQAESLRLLLDGETLATIRMPPVHELTGEDLPHLRRWLARCRVLVSQPIRRDYRGLALGTAQVHAAARPGTRLIVVPIVRFAGLYPEQAIIRPPHDASAVPPLVPYHSLRTLARPAGRRRGRSPRTRCCGSPPPRGWRCSGVRTPTGRSPSSTCSADRTSR
jgi:hypothetical protein